MTTALYILVVALAIVCILTTRTNSRLKKENSELVESYKRMEDTHRTDERIIENVRSSRDDYREKYQKEKKAADEYRSQKMLTVEISTMKEFNDRIRETVIMANKRLQGKTEKIEVEYPWNSNGESLQVRIEMHSNTKSKL